MMMQEAIEQLIKAVSNLETAARSDDKTPLLNQMALRAELDILPVEHEKAVVIFGDLNGFKAVNDIYGHSAGDAAIDKVGTLLRDVLQPFKAIAFRQSGDEFVIIVTDDEEDSVFSELQKSFKEVIVSIDKESFKVRMSFGWTRIDSGTEPEVWLDRAEAACRLAKQDGDGTIREWIDSIEERDKEYRYRCGSCGCSVQIRTSKGEGKAVFSCPQCKTGLTA